MRPGNLPFLPGVPGADTINTTGTDIASASSIDLGRASGVTVTITGTTTITALGTAAAGVTRRLFFTGCLCFTYNATSLILPRAQDLFCVPGDVATFVSLGSGNWSLASFEPFQPLDNKVTINLASGCSVSNTGTVTTNAYANSLWTMTNNSSTGFARANPNVSTGLPGLLPGGSVAGRINWSKPFAVSARLCGAVSNHSSSAAGFGFFFGVLTTSIALAAEGAMFVCRGTNTTSAVSFTASTHDGTTLNTGNSTAGTLTTATLQTYLFRWVPGQGFFVFIDGTLVSKSTANLPAGDGPADSNIFAWAMDNTSGNVSAATFYATSITVCT